MPTPPARPAVPADWDATEEFPDSGARPAEPVERHDVGHGPVLAMVPARRGLGLNLVLLLGGAAALVGFAVWLLRA